MALMNLTYSITGGRQVCVLPLKHLIYTHI